MTWRYVIHLFLFVFLSMMDLSEGGCSDYFQVDKWEGKDLKKSISLVKTQDPRDTMECTVEKECVERNSSCHILRDCFRKHKSKTKKCIGDTYITVPYYLFMCLAAEAIQRTRGGVNHSNIKGCEYLSTCNLYPEEASTAFAKSTTLLPLGSTATTAATRTTTSTTISRTAVIFPETMTTAGEELSDKSTADTQCTVTGDGEKIVLSILAISLSINAAMLIWTYKCCRRRHDQQSTICVSSGDSLELQPMKRIDEEYTIENCTGDSANRK